MWINKNASVKIFIVLTVLIISCGWAKTEISSFKDPAYTVSSLRKIMILVPLQDLGLRRQAEQTITQKIKERGVIAVPSMEILLPTRSYTEYEEKKALQDNGIDSVLSILVAGAQSTTAYYYVGGYTVPVNSPTVTFTLNLFDINSGTLVWTATSTTKGNAYADYSDIFDSLSSATVKKLEADGLLK